MTEVRVIENVEDFGRWDWGSPDPRVVAAELVLRTLIADAMIEFGVHDGEVCVEFWTFDAEVMLAMPFAEMVKWWIEVREDDRSGKIEHPEDRLASGLLLRALEDGVARLRLAMTENVDGA